MNSNVATWPPDGATQDSPMPESGSPEGLQLILKVLDKMRNQYILSFDTGSRKETLETLPVIQRECARLKKNPQLFESVEAYDSFFEEVERSTAQIMYVISSWREHHSRWEGFAEKRTEERYQAARPSFSKELMTQPWQQFLSSDAPGWPLRWQPGPDVVSKQYIPNGGVRLLEKWEDDVRRIYDWIDMTRGGPSRFRSALNEYLNKTLKSEDGTTRISTMGSMPHSPYPGVLYATNEPAYKGDLAHISLQLGRLEQHMGDTEWKVMIVRHRKVDKLVA